MPAETAEIPTRLTGAAPRDSAPELDPGVPNAGAVGAAKAGRASQASKTEYIATVYPGPQTALPDDLAQAIKRAETALGIPIWMLIQNHEDPFPYLDEDVVNACRQARLDLPKNQKVGLLIASPGR